MAKVVCLLEFVRDLPRTEANIAAFLVDEVGRPARVHPPYWRQKLYANDPRDLSRCPTLDAFCNRLHGLLLGCEGALEPGGRLAVLMGDYRDREAGFVPLTYHTKRLAFRVGLGQHVTDIIRFSHGASSGGKTYRSRFIPGLHDTCVVFEKAR